MVRPSARSQRLGRSKTYGASPGAKDAHSKEKMETDSNFVHIRSLDVVSIGKIDDARSRKYTPHARPVPQEGRRASNSCNVVRAEWAVESVVEHDRGIVDVNPAPSAIFACNIMGNRPGRVTR